MHSRVRTYVLPLIATFLALPANPQTGNRAPENALLAPRPFLHIPGPNPIISRGGKGAWDENYIEAGDVIKDSITYYFYYHGAPIDLDRWGRKGYRVGVAEARHPLGPWTKIGDKPLVDLGPPGSWDESGVACPTILKEAPGKYLMWYCGIGQSAKTWSIGLATAPSPAGPWTKYEKNPVMPLFGYVSSVIKRDGKYLMYSEYPISATANDYGPLSLATADSPTGPWTQWSGNPVLPAGQTGAWDDAGYSEAKVMYREGVFHVFYGGAKEERPRRLTQESIGYAYSFDGYHFIKYGGNPVAAREGSPNAAAFAEVHALFEPPFVYAYHTLRYIEPKDALQPGGIDVEDLGVEVLAMERSFQLPVPALVRATLPPAGATRISECAPISLEGASRVSVVAEGKYGAGAKAGMRVHIRSSVDGILYDTADLLTFEGDFRAGSVGRKSVQLTAPAKFIKLAVENLDRSQPISDVKLTVVLGSGQ